MFSWCEMKQLISILSRVQTVLQIAHPDRFNLRSIPHPTKAFLADPSAVDARVLCSVEGRYAIKEGRHKKTRRAEKAVHELVRASGDGARRHPPSPSQRLLQLVPLADFSCTRLHSD